MNPSNSNRYSILHLAFFILSLFSTPLFAAAQNKVIVKKFNWQVAQTEHFDIYFYPGTERLVNLAAARLEKAYRVIPPKLGVQIPGRSSFFLFLNHNEFEQNNIVDVGEGTGGVTEAFKNRFLVFNDGTQEWLQHVIFHEFTHVNQFTVLYGGFWKSVRLLKSVLYPLWFMEGMAEYYSGDIDDVQKDMVLRDAVTSNNYLSLTMLHGFNHVKPHQVTLAYKTGNAALEYISREYGRDKIGVLLKSIAEKFDMSSTLQETAGISLSQLDQKLHEDLQEKYEEDVERMKEPEFYGEPLTRPDHIYPVFNSNPAFFPDGNQVAYISDKDGYNEIFIYDLALSRSLPLRVQKKYPEEIENIHTNGSALSISPDGRTLLFAGEKEEKDYLYLYDVKRDRIRRIDYPLDSVASPQFSPDGKQIAFVGMKGGVNDLYLSGLDGKGMKQLTHTFEDENFVRFFPDGKRLLFVREIINPATSLPERNLWTLSLETGRETQLTKTPGHSIQPAISPSGKEILFSGDMSGTANLYRLSLDGKLEPERMTDVVGGNFDPVYSTDGKDIVFVSYRRVEQHLYRWHRKEIAALPSHISRNRINRVEDEKIEQGEIPSKEKRSLFTGEPKKYKFRASTDFFFPILFYSSTDGLFLSAYWQASEMLGNHQIQAAVSYASALNFLNYQINYSYLKFRPQIFLGFLGDTEENVFVTARESRREDAQFIGVAYPLTRFDQLQFRFLTTHRRVQFTDDQLVTFRVAGREDVASVSFQRDVSERRFLETTSGYRISMVYDDSNGAIGSESDYRNLIFALHEFVPLPKESALAFRLTSAASFGRDRQFFRTGGADLLRGFGRFESSSAASRFAVTNLELRFPIFLNLNYHVWFLFPDFLFKNIYGVAFTDNGVLWNERDELLNYKLEQVKNSIGTGLRFQTFVLQTFPLIISFDWAVRTSDGVNAFYLGLGPNF